MLGVPIQVWASKSFTARWTAKAPAALQRGLSVDVRSRGVEYAGSVTNHLEFPLQECLFVVESQAYRLGELRPGQTASLSASRDLKSMLTDATFGAGASGATRFREYNRLGFDVEEILRTMTFYERVDGLKLTQILHRYQSHVDLSHMLNPQLKKKRGVLIAFGKDPAAQVTLDKQPAGNRDKGTDKQWTCYRFVVELDR
jgi:hypothetical protein